MPNSMYLLACERAHGEEVSKVADDDLVRVIAGQDVALTLPIGVIARSTVLEISEKLGISPARAVRVVAAMELGRRASSSPPARGERCLSPEKVYELFRDLATAEVEEFHIAMLDVRGRLLGRRMIARGSISQCPVSPRDLLRVAIRDGAHSIILVHCHPSGHVSPSVDDLALTERLRAASDLCGVLVRDHLIIGSEGYYSFVEAGTWRR